MTDIAAVILAAGRSTRFAGDQPDVTKLTAAFNGKPLVRHVADAALAATARPVIVVTGHAQALVQEALAGFPLSFVFNQDYATGLASSLRAGVAHVPDKAAGALVLLGDMPLISAETIERILRAYEEADKADAIVPTAGGRRGNPVLIARSLFPAVATLGGDEGARKLLQQPDIRVVETAVPSESIRVDIDTRDALERWQGRGGTAGHRHEELK